MIMFKSRTEVREFVDEFFNRLMQDKEIRNLWVGLRTVVVVNITDWDLWFTIDSKNQPELMIKCDKCDNYDLLLMLPFDTFHRIYTGRQGMVSAFALRKIKTKGSVGIIMKTTWTLSRAIAIYKNLCEERDVPLDLKKERVLPGKKRPPTKIPYHPVDKSRTEKLRTRLFSGEDEVCVQRTRYLTESFKKTEGEPIIIRQAKALYNILAKIEIHIYPDELIVGNITSKPLGAGIFPEFIGYRILAELDTLETRETNPFKISDSEKKELQQIMQYWDGKTVYDIARTYMSDECKHVMDSIGVFILTEIAGISHIILNYPKILTSGFEGIKAEAVRRLATAEKEGNIVKRDFYNAVIIVCDGVCEFARRHAMLATELAKKEKNPARKKELELIANVCTRACRVPTTTFHEALQTIWFCQIVAHIESYEQGISLGRFDQYLLPCYLEDIKSTRLTKEKAVELLCCLFIKMSQSIPLFDSEVTVAFEGMPTNQGLTLGGTLNGRDATNPLTYLVIEAIKRVKTRQPNIHLRVHKNTPRALLRESCASLGKGASQPSMFNDMAIVPALVSKGIAKSDAENYATVGCVEISVPYKTYGSTDAALLNLSFCLETALNGGKGRILPDVCSIPVDDAKKFSSMDDVLRAFRKQVEYFVRQMCEGAAAVEKAHQIFKPTPFLSSFIDGCMEKGEDIIFGSAVYNFTGVQGVGIADVADSLAAIDKVIFQAKASTMVELIDALDNDFEGYDELRIKLRKAPKYGNNRPLPDKYFRLVGEIFGKEVEKYTNPRGGKYLPGFLSMTTHRAFGFLTGALPNGRKAGLPLSNGISPSDGNDISGPTSMLQSAAKLNNIYSANGPALNVKFSPSVFKGGRTEPVIDLVCTYFELGGMHLQVNVVDKETLLDAKQHPDQYRDLIVRVSGFCARFVDLSEKMKDEIIARTEYGRW